MISLKNVKSDLRTKGRPMLIENVNPKALPPQLKVLLDETSIAKLEALPRPSLSELYNLDFYPQDVKTKPSRPNFAAIQYPEDKAVAKMVYEEALIRHEAFLSYRLLDEVQELEVTGRDQRGHLVLAIPTITRG